MPTVKVPRALRRVRGQPSRRHEEPLAPSEIGSIAEDDIVRSYVDTSRLDGSQHAVDRHLRRLELLDAVAAGVQGKLLGKAAATEVTLLSWTP